MMVNRFKTLTGSVVMHYLSSQENTPRMSLLYPHEP